MEQPNFTMSTFLAKEDLFKAKAKHYQDLANKLLNLCEEHFTDGMIQPYAGATRECMYCGAMQPRTGEPHHSAADCPIMKYRDILNT